MDVIRTTTATPEQVWAVLADGWSYPSWVVGASRMRQVGADWPAPGSALHHSIGAWPALLDDETVVEECEPFRRLVLQAKTRPAGVQTVEIELVPHGAGTRLTMREDVTSGPGRLVPSPARRAALAARNREALLRLCLLAERAEG